MAIDLRHFRCFVAVAEDQHFHKAAKRLGVAQPALSRTIQNLESEIGIKLFNRNNRNVEITPAGKVFLRGCRDTLTKATLTVEDARRAHDGKIGTLRIGYTDNAINGVAPQLLKRFQQTHPDIELKLTHTVTSNQLTGLNEGVFDFGFATGPVSRPTFESYRIQREIFVCVVYEGHRLAQRSTIHLKELRYERMVQGDPKNWDHFNSYLIPMFRKAGFEPEIVQEGLTTNDIIRLVACGMGITVLTESVADTLPTGLRAIPLKGVSDRLDTVVLWKSDQQNTAKAHFIAYFKNVMTASPNHN